MHEKGFEAPLASSAEVQESKAEQSEVEWNWSEVQRKAIVLAIALRMQESAHDRTVDHGQELFSSADLILRVLTEPIEFLEANRDMIFRSLDEQQVRSFVQDLAASDE